MIPVWEHKGITGGMVSEVAARYPSDCWVAAHTAHMGGLWLLPDGQWHLYRRGWTGYSWPTLEEAQAAAFVLHKMDPLYK